MTTRLTPEQALDPETVERLAIAEWAYGRIMHGWLLPPQWAEVSKGARDEWRAKARELLADLVAEAS